MPDFSHEPIVYYNDTFVAQSNAQLPFQDIGFVYGATVTEQLRTFRHQLFRWDDHLKRFRDSCRYTNIYPTLPEDEIAACAEELVAHNATLLGPHQELTLVMFVTPGPLAHYSGENETEQKSTTFVMHTFPMRFERFRIHFERGVRLVIPRTRQIPPEIIDPRVKHRSRMHWWLAQQEVNTIDRSAQALLLDGNGFVTETATSNFLIVKDGTVFSPPLQTILNGVSLTVVRELCDELAIPFEERSLTQYDCFSADEAFLTSTPYCIAGVRRIDGQLQQWPGPVFEQLLEAWSEKVGLDIRGQILG